MAQIKVKRILKQGKWKTMWNVSVHIILNEIIEYHYRF